MASQRGEHLLVLNQACKGLLCRVHWMTRMSTPKALDSKELVRVLRHFRQTWPKMNTEEIQQLKGFELIQQRSEDICAQLQDWYYTISDVVAFNKQVLRVIQDAFCNGTLMRSPNHHFLMLALELLAGFVKLQIAMQYVKEKQVYITAYIMAYEVVQGKRDDQLGAILEYCNEYMGLEETRPELRMWHTMLRLRTNCEPMCDAVGTVAEALWNPINKWANPTSFEKNGMFSILYDSSRILQPASTDRYLELTSLNSIREWMNYALLVCPTALQKENPRFCMQKIIGHYFVTPIFRELTFNTLEVWDKTFLEFKCGHKSQGTKFYLKKHREPIFKQAYIRGNICALNHRTLRRYLQVHLRQYICLFSEIPGLAAPKFQLVLALIKLGSDEIQWYLQHVKAEPYKSRKQNWVASLSRDPEVIKLIEAVSDLCTLVTSHAKLVKDYFLEYLRGIDANKCEVEVKKFLQGYSDCPRDKADTLMGFVQRARSCSLEANFNEIKLEYFCLASWLSSSECKCAPGVVVPLVAILNETYAHFSNVLQTERMLAENANLGGLFWYADEMKELVKWTLTDGKGYSSAMHLVRVLGHAKYDLDLKYCPDEQIGQIKKAVRMGDALMDEICRTVLKEFNKMFKNMVYLNDSTGTRLQLQKVRQLMSKKKSSDFLEGDTPANESKYDGKKYWQMQTAAQKLGALLDAIRNTTQCQIYKSVISTRDWLYEALDKHVFNIISSIFKTGMSGGKDLFCRPTTALTSVRALIRTVGYVEQHLPLNTSDIMRGNFLKHFSQVSVGTIGQTIVLEKKSTNLIQKIARFYWDVVAPPSVSFSPLKRMFWTRNARRGAIRAEDFTSVPELYALVQMVGPYGVKAIQSVIFANLTPYLQTMRQIMAKNGVHLGQLDFVDLDSWWGNVQKIVDKNEFLKAAIQVGKYLQFLSLLKAAQRSVQNDYIPFVSDVIRLVMNRIEDDAKIQPGKQLSNVIADSGVEIPEYDSGVKNLFSKVFTDGGALNHLPKMFACLFYSDVWRESRFEVNTEGFNTGIECTIKCIQTMIPAVCNSAEAKQAMLKDFVILSAYSLLHLNSKNEAQDRNMRSFHVPSMMVFMSTFMETCNGMSMHVLEESLPFTLMRTKIIEIYEKIQSTKEEKSAAGT